MEEIRLSGYVPGAIGRMAELHGTYYHRHWHFGLFFEAKVATELSEFLMRFDADRDGFWAILRGGRVEGGLAIDGLHASGEGAARGKGFGNRLMREALFFCEEQGYPRTFLWTFDGLQAARHLYEKFGFRLAEEREGTMWGTLVLEQKFVLDSPL
jgi:ribosomal protein S18 acetylase RimI-like enzyme